MKIKIDKINKLIKKQIISSTFVFLLVMTASTSYKLKDYGFGSGGVGGATSASYSLEAITGEVGGIKSSSAAYGIGSGLSFTNQANVPVAPTFSNPANYYNKLQLIINTSGNPTDTKYAIAISTDNFATITNYVKSDNTVGATLTLTDYQTYTSWGGASGFFIIGLAPNTTYQVKVKAMQGKFTETAYGPNASAATVSPTLSFSIQTDSLVAPPFSMTFSSLIVNTVIDSPEKIWANFSTNAASGGKVYVIGKNAGLLSSSKGSLINSVSGDLSSLTSGIGAQGFSVSQTSGGPLAIAPAYALSANNVGIVDASVREIFTSAAPIIGGQGKFLLKAKSSSITTAANDYSEIFTLVASGSF
jgi:hypothetical protein